MPRTKLICIFVLFLAAYVGGYAVLLNPRLVGGTYRMPNWREPDYRVGGEFAQVFFWPAAWMDHRIRPSYWDFQYPQYQFLVVEAD